MRVLIVEPGSQFFPVPIGRITVDVVICRSPKQQQGEGFEPFTTRSRGPLDTGVSKNLQPYFLLAVSQIATLQAAILVFAHH